VDSPLVRQSTTSFRLVRAILAQKPGTSWYEPASIACIVMEDSVGRVYPIFASLFKHDLTTCLYSHLWDLYNTSTPPSGDEKANSRLDQSTIIYIKALNIHSLNPKIWYCLFKPNDWVNYLRYIKETHIYTYQKNILCTSVFKTY
jgi:hypothetical protein